MIKPEYCSSSKEDITVNGQNVDITGFDEKFREEVKAAGFE